MTRTRQEIEDEVLIVALDAIKAAKAKRDLACEAADATFTATLGAINAVMYEAMGWLDDVD